MFQISRLRGGEWIIGGASLALLIVTFFLPWYGLTNRFSPTAASLGEPTTTDGWNSLVILGPLCAIVALLGIAIWYTQATRRSPALPIALTVITVALGTLLFLGLIDRVLLNPPGVLLEGTDGVNTIGDKTGAYAGLILTAVILVGAFLSLREDGLAPADAPQRIETLRLTPRPAAARAR